jgi:hypothetical protein
LFTLLIQNRSKHKQLYFLIKQFFTLKLIQTTSRTPIKSRLFHEQPKVNFSPLNFWHTSLQKFMYWFEILKFKITSSNSIIWIKKKKFQILNFERNTSSASIYKPKKQFLVSRIISKNTIIFLSFSRFAFTHSHKIKYTLHLICYFSHFSHNQ